MICTGINPASPRTSARPPHQSAARALSVNTVGIQNVYARHTSLVSGSDQTMNGAVAACVVALQAFAWPHIENWHGLPAGCEVSHVGKVLTVPDDGWRGSGYLGDSHRPLAWLSANGGGFPDSVRVWLDGDRVVLMETRILGKPGDFHAAVARLGPPAAKLGSYFDVKMEKSEWVYPDRGLTLFVNPENQIPLGIAVYAPTTLDGYCHRVRPITGPRARR
jgi:hypothetical protein